MINRAGEIVQRISYKDWWIGVFQKGDECFLQLRWDEADTDSPHTLALVQQKSRKWLLSKHMTDSEIVQTVFLAIRTAEEHEIRERFKYLGATIFGPHFDCDQLANLINEGALPTSIRTYHESPSYQETNIPIRAEHGELQGLHHED